LPQLARWGRGLRRRHRTRRQPRDLRRCRYRVNAITLAGPELTPYRDLASWSRGARGPVKAGSVSSSDGLVASGRPC